MYRENDKVIDNSYSVVEIKKVTLNGDYSFNGYPAEFELTNGEVITEDMILCKLSDATERTLNILSIYRSINVAKKEYEKVSLEIKRLQDLQCDLEKLLNTLTIMKGRY